MSTTAPDCSGGVRGPPVEVLFFSTVAYEDSDDAGAPMMTRLSMVEEGGRLQVSRMVLE